MPAYAVLFRGINVGGKNIIQMKELSKVLEGAGFSDVQTYIQSGNAVLTYNGKSPEVESHVRESVLSAFGFEPEVMVYTAGEIRTALENNPFKDTDPGRVQAGFMNKLPDNPDIEKMNTIKKESEEFSFSGRIFYLSAPEGIGKSKLASSCEKLIGTDMTMRNMRTVTHIAEMLQN